MNQEKDKDIIDNLMNVQSTCPNCGIILTFESAARLAKDKGVNENAIMCHDCHKVFNVRLTPNKMTILEELTQYNFSTENSERQKTKIDLKTDKRFNLKSNNSVINQNKNYENNNCSKSHRVNINSSKSPRVNNYYEINPVLKIFLYKSDAVTGLYRISKGKLISLVWFISWIILTCSVLNSQYGHLEFIDIFVSIIMALIFTAPVYVFAWLIGKIIGNHSNKNAQIPNNLNNDSQISNVNNQNKSNQEVNTQSMDNKSTNETQKDLQKPNTKDNHNVFVQEKAKINLNTDITFNNESKEESEDVSHSLNSIVQDVSKGVSEEASDCSNSVVQEESKD